MIGYEKFSSDWKSRAAYCATLSVGAIALFLSVFLIAQTVRVALAADREGDFGPSISVRGTGKVVAAPEDIIATFSFGAQATSESVETAQEQSAKTINDAIAFLKEQGVDEKDIQTTAYDVYPRYEWIEQPCTAQGYCPGGRSVPVGFDVNQTVTVKLRDTSKAGDALSGIGKFNVTNISGLNFGVDDEEALRDKARQAAIEDAKARAESLGESLGFDLDRIVGMYEYQKDPGYPYPMYAEQAMGGDMAVRLSPDVPVGEQEIEVSVEIQYAIED